LAPFRVLGHDLALAVGIAGLGQQVADRGAQACEPGPRLLLAVGRDVLEQDRVVLVRAQGLFVPAFAAHDQEGEGGGGGAQVAEGESDGFRQDRIGILRDQAVDQPRADAVADETLHDLRQSPVGSDQIGWRAGRVDLGKQDGRGGQGHQGQVPLGQESDRPAAVIDDGQGLESVVDQAQVALGQQGPIRHRARRRGRDRSVGSGPGGCRRQGITYILDGLMQELDGRLQLGDQFFLAEFLGPAAGDVGGDGEKARAVLDGDARQ